MKRFLASLSTFSLIGTIGRHPAIAAGVLTLLGVGGAGGGGGGTGFLASPSAVNFALRNKLPWGNDFTQWTGAGSGGSIVAPAVTNITDTLPDGSSGTVSSVVYPAVPTGTTNFTLISGAPVNVTVNANTFTSGVFAKVTSGSTCGTLYSVISTPGPLTFPKASIINDGAWHQITVNVPVGTFTTSANPAPFIGVNQFDPTESGALTCPMTVELAGAYIADNPNATLIAYADVKTGGPLATTSTATAYGIISKALPAHLQFRDFSGLTPDVANNPFLTASPTEIWRNAGLSAPYFSNQFQSGGFYWAMSNCTTTLREQAYTALCLWKSTDQVNWTEDTTNAPYLQAYGSVFAKPTVSSAGSGFTGTSGIATWQGTGCAVTPVIAVTVSGGVISGATPSPNNGIGTGACPVGGWPTASNTNWTYSGGVTGSGASFTFAQVNGTTNISWWLLKPAFLPGGCYDSTNSQPRAFCVIFSALDSSGNQNIYLGWATTINGVYTTLGCTSAGTGPGPGPCSTPQAITMANIPLGFTGNLLPSVTNIGGTSIGGGGINYILMSSASTTAQNAGGVFTIRMSTAADNTVTTAGNTFNYINTGFDVTKPTADWDYADGATTYADNYIYRNRCGFYELFYTAINFNNTAPFSAATHQFIGYGVSATVNGPIYKYPGPIIPGNSSLYGGTEFIGDSVFTETGGTAWWSGGTDSGGLATGVRASMPQGTGCP